MIKYISTRRICPLVALLCLFPASNGWADCIFSLVGDSTLRLGNVDPIASGQPQIGNDSLQLTTNGECTGSWRYRIVRDTNHDNQLDPALIISASNAVLYNTADPSAGASGLLDGDATPPLTISLNLQANPQGVPPAGNVGQNLILQLTPSQNTGTTGMVSVNLSYEIEVLASLQASFTGAEVNGMSQSFGQSSAQLTMGTLNGQSSGSVNFNVLSNANYNITVQSQNLGQLNLESESGYTGSIRYLLQMDGSTLSLADDGMDALQNRPASSTRSGETHAMRLWSFSDMNTVRAGHYSDTLTVTVEQTL